MRIPTACFGNSRTLSGIIGIRSIDPRPWCQGFYAAINLNIKKWKRLLDLNNPNHGLLLPILIY